LSAPQTDGPEPLASNSDTTTLAKEQIVMSFMSRLFAAARSGANQTIVRTRQLAAAVRRRADRTTLYKIVYVTSVALVAATSGAATFSIYYPEHPWVAVVLAATNAASTVRTVTSLGEQIGRKLRDRRMPKSM
jgi:hypothetical protein